MKTHPLFRWLCFASAVLSLPAASAQAYPAFNPVISTTIDAHTADLADGVLDGVIRYSSYTVRAGRKVRYINSADPQRPVIIHVTGNVSIQGVVDVSGNSTLSTRNPGPGGHPGGAAGRGVQVGQPGLGSGGGMGGGLPEVQGCAGGGGGHATPGLSATSRSGLREGAGGVVVARQPITSASRGVGGSGGGGGGGRLVSGVAPVSGGVGGGGGGAIRIRCEGSFTIGYEVLPDDWDENDCGIWANGANGGTAYGNGVNTGMHAGPGGGGAGGVIELSAPECVKLLQGAFLSVRGGFGGGISSQPVPRDPEFYSCGAHGGDGYVFFDTPCVQAEHTATIQGMEQWWPGYVYIYVTPDQKHIIYYSGTLYQREVIPGVATPWTRTPTLQSPYHHDPKSFKYQLLFTSSQGPYFRSELGFVTSVQYPY